MHDPIRNRIHKRSLLAYALWIIAFVTAVVALFVDNSTEGNWGGLSAVLFFVGLAVIIRWEKM